jgi:long-subunit fatty acid transport protein
MKLLIVFLLSISQIEASVPELFGQSAGSLAIGQQAQKESAANNYEAPALQGFTDTTQFSFDVFYISTHFTDINNVLIKNETNTVGTNEIGDVKVNATPSMMFGAHLSTPLFSPQGPKLNFSAFAPFDRMMEADTGDPYQPRYVMYQGRFMRPVLMVSGAQSFGLWSYSLGAQTGFQSNGEAYFITRTTPGSPSLSKLSFNAKPSLGLNFSVARKNENKVSYFSFQQEMKSKLYNHATGETEVAGAGVGQFDFDLSSLLYYDPMTLRLGHQIHQAENSYYFSLEFQRWDQYESSILKIKKLGGTINGSDQLENIKTRNIFIPKIGIEHSMNSKWMLKAGYFYRPTPFDPSNLKNPGNSIDVSKHVSSVGVAHLFNFYQKILTLDFAYQAHWLDHHSVTKTPNREDGDPSEQKIGSPGYKVGGMIHVLSMGLNWKY